MNPDQNTMTDFAYFEHSQATRRDTLQLEYGNRESMQIIQEASVELGQSKHEGPMMTAGSCENVVITKKGSRHNKKKLQAQRNQQTGQRAALNFGFALPGVNK